MEENNNNNLKIINPQKQKFWKLIFVFSFIGLGFAGLIVRLVYLQIIDAEKYQKIARMQHESKVNLKAERGDIYDRNGRLLATTIKSYSYAIDPTVLTDTLEILRICNLVSIVDTSKNSEENYNRVRRAKGAFVWLTRGILPSKTKLLDSIETRGFIRIIEPKRTYLYSSIGAQVIGCTNVDNRGLTGIELTYDSLLRGSEGYVVMLRDAAGHLLPSLQTSKVEAVKGKSVRLTIDIELQRIVEEELKLGVLKSRSDAGTVIIIQPQTGEILAMASYPGYDPNHIEHLKSGTTRNRAITDLYDPGSTFKLITAAIALEENKIDTETIFDGHLGYVKYDDYEIKDEHKTGKMTLDKAMEISSNVIFSSIAYRLSPNVWYKYVRDFGFGLLYGIELSGESKGTIKTPSQLDAITRRFNGFGYSISVTPLQIANAYATVANDGEMMKPHIVKALLVDNKQYKKIKPVKIRRIISEETSKTISDILVGVVDVGTGTQARIAGIRIAGKTGTSQKMEDSTYSKKEYFASFAGYFPADNPKLSMLIVLDNPKGNIYGGSTAAPIFRNISKSWISVSKELQQTLFGSEEGDESTTNIIVPNLIGLDIVSAEKILNDLGLRYDVPGDDFIIGAMVPKPGTVLFKPGKVIITLIPNSLFADSNSKELNLKGMNINQAVTILSKRKILPEVHGSGIVNNYSYYRDSSGVLTCRLYCRQQSK